MLIEIYECVECSRRLVKIGDMDIKAHNCGGALKLLADAEVSTLRLRDVLRTLPKEAVKGGAS